MNVSKLEIDIDLKRDKMIEVENKTGMNMNSNTICELVYKINNKESKKMIKKIPEKTQFCTKYVNQVIDTTNYIKNIKKSTSSRYIRKTQTSSIVVDYITSEYNIIHIDESYIEPIIIKYIDNIIKKYGCKNLVKPVEIKINQGYSYIISEKCEGDITKVIKELTDEDIEHIILQMIVVYYYIHKEHKIFKHNDLHVKNILYNKRTNEDIYKLITDKNPNIKIKDSKYVYKLWDYGKTFISISKDQQNILQEEYISKLPVKSKCNYNENKDSILLSLTTLYNRETDKSNDKYNYISDNQLTDQIIDIEYLIIQYIFYMVIDEICNDMDKEMGSYTKGAFKYQIYYNNNKDKYNIYKYLNKTIYDKLLGFIWKIHNDRDILEEDYVYEIKMYIKKYIELSLGSNVVDNIIDLFTEKYKYFEIKNYEIDNIYEYIINNLSEYKIFKDIIQK